jgi:hypothetical protein
MFKIRILANICHDSKYEDKLAEAMRDCGNVT